MTENHLEQGTSRTEGTTHTLHFTLTAPHPVETVWGAVATPAGLAGWLAAADVLEPRLGGAVTLRAPGDAATHPGRITAWDVERIAEYTFGGRCGRVRFHLEPATTLRFTHAFEGDDALRRDRLAAWHDRLLRLRGALDGR
ncbi:hypothetical protein GTW43_33765 [Streptomyces sp. SID5785]|uniref:SRPBCC domain-containing protein n=1 Tax=Streptomyces sp. SID5785 TaxID=2690309 RepID=UPI001361AD82|nr:SRPBCC domain-containing protein [Streptomyces sp. SID5785]MZD10012.1 hypothetical protein [Streptomyces sp. SID5785]